MSDDAAIHVGFLLSAILIIALLPLLSCVPHVCLVQSVLGVPCPGCGITTGTRAILRAEFAAGWHANPASFAVTGLVMFQLLARSAAVFFGSVQTAVSRISRHLATAVTVALMAVWVFNLVVRGI